MSCWSRSWLVVLACVCLAAAASAQPVPAAPETRMLVGDQKVMEPGFAVGDIAIGDPAVADFRVRPGRKAILLIAKRAGQTKLILWDQRGSERHEYQIVVETAEQAQAETKLRGLLRDFPSVKVERLGGGLVVTGSVSAQEDLALIQRMAESTGAESFVRYVAPETRATRPAPPPSTATPTTAPPPAAATGAPGAVAPATAPPATSAPPPATPPATRVPAAPPAAATPAAATTPPPASPPAAAEAGDTIEYEVQLLEASSAFGSASYETGIEPSGRVLHSGKVLAPLGGDGQLFIPAKAFESKDTKTPKGATGTDGMRITLTPTELDGRDLTTKILIETNVPVKSKAYVPGGWRRARWQSENDITAPFSIAGADLLVIPELSGGGGALSKVSGLLGLAGASSVPGSEYTSAASYVPYDKERKTQLLLLIRPRAVPAGRE